MKKISYLFVACIGCLWVAAQNQVGIGTTSPNPSALLELQSTTKGLLITRMSSTQRNNIVDPANGLLVYDTDKMCVYLYDGMEWKPLLTGNESTLPGTTVAADDLADYDFFGTSVSISGNTTVIGANRNGNQVGAAYVFMKSNNGWTLQAKLVPDDGGLHDYFGAAVTISGDYILVGAPMKNSGKGSVYAFARAGNTWSLMTQLKPDVETPNARFGSSVSMFGIHAFVGAFSYSPAGAVFTFKRTGAGWGLQQKFTGPSSGSNFGYDVEVYNGQAIVGAPNTSLQGITARGGAYIYKYLNNAWVASDTILGNYAMDGLGTSVSISESYAAVGIPGADGVQTDEGAVSLYSYGGGKWYYYNTLYPTIKYRNFAAKFGTNVSINGELLLVNANATVQGEPGGVFLYKRNPAYPGKDRWRLKARMVAEDLDMDEDNFLGDAFINGFNICFTYPNAVHGKGKVVFKNLE